MKQLLDLTMTEHIKKLKHRTLTAPRYLLLEQAKIITHVYSLAEQTVRPAQLPVSARTPIADPRPSLARQPESTFVTRAKSNFDYRRLYYRKVDKTTAQSMLFQRFLDEFCMPETVILSCKMGLDFVCRD